MTMKESTLVASVVAALALGSTPAAAQEIFHSTQSANLPTAEMLNGGNWLFEISHRFGPPISDGASRLWGLDGGVFNRLGLVYAPSDRAMLGVQRTNNEDNLELNVKVSLIDAADGSLPLKVAAFGGVAWNTEALEVQGAQDNETQLYGQLLINLGLGEQVAVGIVPTFLRNPRIRDAEADNAFVLGIHGQVYLSRSMSVLGEWIVSESRVDQAYDSGALALEIETRGHFFKLVLTNQRRMNPTQYLGGSQHEFKGDELRLGFNITRLLPF